MPNNNREWLKRCFNCMEPVDTPDAKCRRCGWDNHDRKNGDAALEQTILKDQYIVGKCLGRGGFGITYVGFDIALERRVAIKEYFPVGTAYRFSDGVTIRAYTKSEEDYQSGLNQALQESRTIAKLGQIPNVMQVYNVFLENGTVYMVMEYIDGISLADEVKQNGKLNWKDALHRLYPIMDALEKIHARGMIHRDISPENIIRRNETGEPVLLDFGSARQPKEGLTVMLKPGYAPAEQYNRNAAQDGRVDEYALCATMYYLLTGNAPASADLRMFAKKELKRPSEYADDIPVEIEKVLLKGMELNSGDRYPSMKELHQAFLKAEQDAGKVRRHVKPSPPKPPRSQKAGTVPETGKKNGLLMKITAIAIAATIGCLVGYLFLGNAGNKKSGEEETNVSSVQSSGDESEGNETVEPEKDKTPAPQPKATNTPTPEPTAANTPTPAPTATNTPTPEPTATNTPTPEPMATEETAAEEDAVAEKSEGVMTYAEYVEAGLDFEVVVETYVQAKQSWWEDKASIYTQDEDGAYFIYQAACSEEDFEKLVPGQKIKVTGYKSEWAGEIEIVDSSIEIEDGNYIAEPIDATNLLGTDELIDHQNQLVSFKGLTVEAKTDEEGNEHAFFYNWDNSGAEGDDLYFDASINGETYSFTVESYLCDSESDVYKAVKELKVGDVIDMEGFLYWYEGANPHITAVSTAE